MIFQVLVVDDEPHVIETIMTLLDKLPEFDVELHVAYRAKQALSIMKQGRIDLLLTDVQMPGISGLELIREVRQNWPSCMSAILTAHADFSYAYQAINLGVTSYILKTEDEPEILKHLRSLLQILSENFHNTEPVDVPALTNVQQALMTKLLYDAKIDEPSTIQALKELGFHPEEATLLPVFAISAPRTPLSQTLLMEALSCYLAPKLRHLACIQLTDNHIFLLLELEADEGFLLNSLETVQTSMENGCATKTAFLVDQPYQPTTPLAMVQQSLKRLAETLEVDFEMCVMEVGKAGASARVTMEYLKNYIKAHINEDLSLVHLAGVTGYNPSYLSRLFSTHTHEPLVRYIARKRLKAINALMLDPDLSLEQIMSLMHFNSRSYFNSFIKKETGLSPKKYRAQIGGQQQED